MKNSQLRLIPRRHRHRVIESWREGSERSMGQRTCAILVKRPTVTPPNGACLIQTPSNVAHNER